MEITLTPLEPGRLRAASSPSLLTTPAQDALYQRFQTPGDTLHDRFTQFLVAARSDFSISFPGRHEMILDYTEGTYAEAALKFQACLSQFWSHEDSRIIYMRVVNIKGGSYFDQVLLLLPALTSAQLHQVIDSAQLYLQDPQAHHKV